MCFYSCLQVTFLLCYFVQIIFLWRWRFKKKVYFCSEYNICKPIYANDNSKNRAYAMH